MNDGLCFRKAAGFPFAGAAAFLPLFPGDSGPLGQQVRVLYFPSDHLRDGRAAPPVQLAHPLRQGGGLGEGGRIALIAGLILLLAFNMLNGLILYASWAMVEDLGEVPELGLRVLLLLAALLLVALGAAMPHLKRNHWIGVRTKWSLQSDAVWAKSQRFGGRAFAVAGLLSLLSLFLPSPWTALVFIASTAAAAVASLLYSRREGRREKQSP